MKKKDDVVDFDDDDEMRISASRNRATATLSTEELSQGLSVCGSPLILTEKCEGVQDIDDKRDTY